MSECHKRPALPDYLVDAGQTEPASPAAKLRLGRPFSAVIDSVQVYVINDIGAPGVEQCLRALSVLERPRSGDGFSRAVDLPGGGLPGEHGR